MLQIRGQGQDDIYDSLSFEDKNKLTENFVENIQWDLGANDRTLKGLMEKRFTKLLSDGEDKTISWDDVFDESKEMPGHQKKYQFILERTFLRPRDIIKFSNEVLKSFKTSLNSGEDRDNSSKITNRDIHNTKQSYGDYLLRELDDEIHKHLPNYEAYFELFRTIGVAQFSMEQFLEAYEKKKSELKIEEGSIEILKELFSFSVIGFYKAGGSGFGGSEYVFKHKNPRARFDESASKFKLHLGFVDILGLSLWQRSK